MNEQSPRSGGPATYQDVLDAPPNLVAELVGGRPAPAAPPGVAACLGVLRPCRPARRPLPARHRRPGGLVIFAIEPELHLGPDVLVPDLAGWRRERMGEYPDAPAIELAPDWVCELLSPGTRRFDLTEKRALYGAQGVGHLWLVDPEAQTLEAFELRAGAWVLVAALEGRRGGAGGAVRGGRLPAVGALAGLMPEPGGSARADQAFAGVRALRVGQLAQSY